MIVNNGSCQLRHLLPTTYYLLPIVRQGGPDEIKVGLHLCYGDLGHVHLVEPSDLALSVEMANRGYAAAGQQIDYVHMAVPREQIPELLDIHCRVIDAL